MRTRGILAELCPAQLGTARQHGSIAASTWIIYCGQYIKKMWTCWTMFFVLNTTLFCYLLCFRIASNMVWLLILLLLKWTFDCSCRPIKLNFPYCGRREKVRVNLKSMSPEHFEEKQKGKWKRENYPILSSLNK